MGVFGGMEWPRHFGRAASRRPDQLPVDIRQDPDHYNYAATFLSDLAL